MSVARHATAKIAFAGIICELERGTGQDIMTTPKRKIGAVFLVEDEAMIRMMVAEMLEDLGYTVTAEASDIDEAVKLAQSARFDVAILDVNVNGKVVTPVAKTIEARRLPFVFVTGYGVQGIPEEFRSRPALQKPFQMDMLAGMIEKALGSAAA
jgi:CheY-like chemotaxis protein